MNMKVQTAIRKLAVALGFVLLAACGPTKPPASTPPPPPVVVVAPEPAPIPMRPIPPRNASAGMLIPAVGADGVRDTVNAHLNPLEAVWNFRAAWNVAALNCLDARYQPILDGYKVLLTKHKKRLTKVNTDLDKQYRTEYGAKATRTREAYLTQVYNYFALPPAQDYFCDAALDVSQQMLLAPPTDIDAFALTSLPKLEAAFEHFFQDMEHYRIAVAQWDAKYGTLYGPGADGRAYASATYGPPSSPSADVTIARPVAEDFTLTAAPSEPQPVSVTDMPVVQPLPGQPNPAQQPAFSSQPVVQGLPPAGN